MKCRYVLCVLVLCASVQACGDRKQGDTSVMRGIEGATAPVKDEVATPCGSKDLVEVSGECIPAQPDSIQSAQLVIDALCIGTALSSKCEPRGFKYSYRGAVTGAKIARGILSHVQTNGDSKAIADANVSVMDALLGNIEEPIAILERSIPQVDYATQVHQDVVVCQFRASTSTNYPLYLVQPSVAGVQSLTRMVPASEPSVLFRDGSLCHLLGPVEPTFALSRNSKSPDERFSAARKAGFSFFGGEGGSMFIVKQEGPKSRTGKLRWYMEANLSILMLARSLREANLPQ